MLPTRCQICMLSQIEVRDAAFLSRKDISRRCKDHAALLIGFVGDLNFDQYNFSRNLNGSTYIWQTRMISNRRSRVNRSSKLLTSIDRRIRQRNNTRCPRIKTKRIGLFLANEMEYLI